MPTHSPATICHHCGRNYAAEYWDSADPGSQVPLEPPVDPRVCPTCCRNSNPDAPPSSWTPPSTDIALPETILTFRVRKRCYVCGVEWDGRAFTEPTPDAVIPGTCPGCLDADERRVAALTAPRREPPLPNAPLQRPVRAFGYDD